MEKSMQAFKMSKIKNKGQKNPDLYFNMAQIFRYLEFYNESMLH